MHEPGKVPLPDKKGCLYKKKASFFATRRTFIEVDSIRTEEHPRPHR